MPLYSVEAARAWRAQHVAPVPPAMARRAPAAQRGREGAPASSARAVSDLQELAYAALEAGQPIGFLEPTLRAAMAAVPPAERDQVELVLEVMDVLCAEVSAAVEANDADQAGADGAAPGQPEMTDQDALWLGQFWYSVAAGEYIVATGEAGSA